MTINITHKGLFGIVVLFCLGVIILGANTMYETDVLHWTDNRAVNYTAWITEPDSIVGADTTAFFLSNAGSGQILIVNPDADDTLGISFDLGTQWFKLPPDYASVLFSPANYDSLHFLSFGATAGDTTITPSVTWTIYSEDR